MSAAAVQCQECGDAVSERRKGACFCAPSCRMAFNNRRRDRGAQMYDLFRALRRERDTAKTLGIWTEMCRLELGWQQEDEAKRPGRRSYVPPKRALTHLKDSGALPMGEMLCNNYRAGR